MPKLVSELHGEPFSFGALPILGVSTDGKSAKIEKAVDISDVCTDIAADEKILMIFTHAPEEHGSNPHVGLLRINAETGELINAMWWMTAHGVYSKVTSRDFDLSREKISELQREFAPW